MQTEVRALGEEVGRRLRPWEIRLSDLDEECECVDLDIREGAELSQWARRLDAPVVWALIREGRRPIRTAVLRFTTEADAPMLAEALMDLGSRRGRADTERLAAQPRRPSASQVDVIVCTRENPDGLRRLLASLGRQTVKDFRVTVVDNAPATGKTREVCDSSDSALDIRYIVERRKGLSHARNRGARETNGRIMAWVDDDEVVDGNWVEEIVRAFALMPRPGVVGGVMLPAELKTEAQRLFELYGGHNKGVALEPAVYTAQGLRAAGRHAVFPLPAFGVGGNMAVDRGVLERVGDFDTALGAGSPAMGGEDTLFLTEVLNAGVGIAFAPSVITRHYHRRDLPALETQLRGYGAGLTAFYIALLRRNPRLIADVARVAPNGIRELVSKHGVRSESVPDDYPRDLLKANRVGLALGPYLYLRGCLRGQREIDGR